MKKLVVTLFTSLIFCMLLPVKASCSDGLETKQAATFMLPYALQEIEEEAFSGTAVETVVLPYGFLNIRQNTFKGAERLTDVYIPPTTKQIEESAFPQNDVLVFHGKKGSYADKWAKTHQIPFIPGNIWNSRLSGTRTTLANGSILIVGNQAIEEYNSVTVNKLLFLNRKKSMRPQDRPELNCIEWRFP